MTKLETLFSGYNKKYKEELLTKGAVVHKCQRIPFSSPRANYILYGGIPRGRLTEFAGAEGSGKTTSSLDIVANAQRIFKQEYEDEITRLEAIEKPNKTETAKLLELRETGPKKVLWVDCENTFDDEWSERLGVSVDELLFMSPQSQSAEQIFEIVINAIDTGELGLVIIDSYGSMMSQQAYDKTLEEKTYGGIASALTQFSKKAEMSCARTNCALIGINQIREDMNSAYGGTTTTGGRAWKHHCSVRLSFNKGDHFDEKYAKVPKSTYENPYGHYVQMRVEKTKICKPNRKLGFYTLEYDNGINSDMDYIDIAIKKDIIKQGGAGWMTFTNPTTGEIACDEDGSPYKMQGLKNTTAFLHEHTELFNDIKQYIDRLISDEI
jgi:recombination protein RecA